MKVLSLGPSLTFRQPGAIDHETLGNDDSYSDPLHRIYVEVYDVYTHEMLRHRTRSTWMPPS